MSTDLAYMYNTDCACYHKLRQTIGGYAGRLQILYIELYTIIMFFTFLTHGYIPKSLMETTIVPIVKNKCGNLSDSNNYRPIAIATIRGGFRMVGALRQTTWWGPLCHST